MTAQFQVDTDRIQAASADITHIAGDIEGAGAGDDGPAHRPRGRLAGGAASQFQSVVGRWQATQAQVKTSLDSIGRVLGAARCLLRRCRGQRRRDVHALILAADWAAAGLGAVPVREVRTPAR